MLDVDLDVILQVLADSRKVLHRVEAERFQLVSVADSGKLQERGRQEGSGSEDHFAGAHLTKRPEAAAVLDPDRTPSLEENARHRRQRLHVQVRPVHHRVEVGPRWREPPPTVNVAVERGEALLAVPVDVVGQVLTGLLHRFEKRDKQRTRCRSAFENERPVVAVERIVGRRGETVLHAFEVRQAVCVVPTSHAALGRPFFVVQRIAALEDHPVDAPGAAEHLAAGVVDAPAAEVWFWLGFELPVVEAIADRHRQRRRHRNQRIPDVIPAPGFKEQHLARAVDAEAVPEHAPG